MPTDEISDWNYIMSTVGNAYWSGLTFDEFWDCVSVSCNREQLDAAVCAAIRVKEIVEETYADEE